MTDSDFRITADTYVVRQCNGGDMCPAKGTEFILTATGAKNIIRLTCVNGDFPGLVNNQGFFCSTQTKQGVELTAVFVYASGEQALTRISLRQGKGKTKGKAILRRWLKDWTAAVTARWPSAAGAVAEAVATTAARGPEGETSRAVR
ncbi:MAG: hypothetical protein MK142_06335 [Pseudomonadales bacterium]|nr:hypothetical protein [Pseudomonadales bacterium]